MKYVEIQDRPTLASGDIFSKLRSIPNPNFPPRFRKSSYPCSKSLLFGPAPTRKSPVSKNSPAWRQAGVVFHWSKWLIYCLLNSYQHPLINPPNDALHLLERLLPNRAQRPGLFTPPSHRPAARQARMVGQALCRLPAPLGNLSDKEKKGITSKYIFREYFTSGNQAIARSFPGGYISAGKRRLRYSESYPLGFI